MDAEGKAPNCHCLDVGDQLLVLAFEGAPAIDDEEYIAPQMVGVMTHGPPPTVGPDGVDVVVPEELLPFVEDLPYLGDGPSCLGRVQPGCDTPDVWEIS